ncbi:MAG: hypothetical protein Q7R35_09585 [Elusimicrobiota bacterium]|nr:hypothetical protein [Elusimicrobiota bacterium]
MSVNVSCACGAAYNLKDEYAGSRLGCPRCGAAILVPALPPAPPVRFQAGDTAFAQDKFLLNERHFGISEKYAVLDKEGASLMFVERPNYIFLNVLAIFGGVIAGIINLIASGVLSHLVKVLGLDPLLGVLLTLWAKLGSFFVAIAAAQALSKRRHITVYRDDSREEVLLRIAQDSNIQLLTASYTVTGADGGRLALIYKKRLRNIFRKRWYVLGPDGPLCTAQEDSIILSALRRMVLGFLGLLHTDFMIYSPGGQVLGEFSRRMTLRDRYVLDMTPDSRRSLDRRVALAFGVLLDTGENR